MTVCQAVSCLDDWDDNNVTIVGTYSFDEFRLHDFSNEAFFNKTASYHLFPPKPWDAKTDRLLYSEYRFDLSTADATMVAALDGAFDQKCQQCLAVCDV